jgi:hypothetical protein
LIQRLIRILVDMLESSSGAPPFTGLRKITQVVRKVLNNERPTRPEAARAIGLTDDVWGIVEACWGQDPGSRLRAFQVVSGLKKAAAAYSQQRSNP